MQFLLSGLFALHFIQKHSLNPLRQLRMKSLIKGAKQTYRWLTVPEFQADRIRSFGHHAL